MTPSRPVVRILDDEPEVRRALARLLRAAGHEVEVFDRVSELLERDQADRPGCLVADLRLDGFSGLDLIPLLYDAGRALPIVFITGYGDIPTSVRAMRAGAIDFLTKPVEDDELLAAVQRALAQDAAARTASRRAGELRARFARLTRRERQVFDLVVQGLLNKQIAGHLGTTERTVKVHRARVMQKMGASSLAGLVHLAEELQRAEPTPPPTSAAGAEARSAG